MNSVVSMALALCGATLLLTIAVMSGWVQPFDDAVNEFIIDAEVSWLVDVSLVFDELGSVPLVLGLIGAVFLLFGLTDRWSTALWWLLMVGSAIVVSEVLEEIVRRPRPVESLIDKASWSYPSGHAMVSGVALGIGSAVFASVRWPARRTALVSVGVGYAIAMAASRVYLRSHWVTDVLAGLMLGCAVVAVFYVMWRHRDRLVNGPESNE